MAYEILETDNWLSQAHEELGSKRKIWLLRRPGERWLFKYSRHAQDGTLVGEHWAEKIASEVAALLNIPHATVELAKRDGEIGAISRDFTKGDARSTLVLGNELLRDRDPAYDPSIEKPHSHTVRRVLRYLRIVALPPEIEAMEGMCHGSDAFVGYLMLDALIGNTDRHHENWGILGHSMKNGQSKRWLSPSFDHASSLGRELVDSKRTILLDGSDPRQDVERYCARGRSPFFDEAPAGPQLSVRQAWRRALTFQPDAAHSWLTRLQHLTAHSLHSCVDDVPDTVMSDTAKRFAVRMLEVNRDLLLNFRTSNS